MFWQSILGTVATMVWLLVLIGCLLWLALARRRWPALLAVAGLVSAAVFTANAFAAGRETRSRACLDAGGVIVATGEHTRTCIDVKRIKIGGEVEWTE